MPRKDIGEASFYKTKSLSIPIHTKEDLPLGNSDRHSLGELSINTIRQGVVNHDFTLKQLEYLVNLLAMRISCYLNNKFVTY
jgi:hypothetical protein